MQAAANQIGKFDKIQLFFLSGVIVCVHIFFDLSREGRFIQQYLVVVFSSSFTRFSLIMFVICSLDEGKYFLTNYIVTLMFSFCQLTNSCE